MIRDIRNFNTPIKTLELDCSTGVLMPLYDADTNMLFLVGKGDTTILYMEVIDREPFLIEGLRHTGEQSKGACLVPKRALRVMEGEVNRVLQLTSSSVIPVTYQVPRKSYRDYHADLYPDTAGPVTYLSAPMWLDNMDHAVPTISLDPAAASCAQVHRGNLDDLVKAILAMPVPKKQDSKKPEPKAEEPKPAPKTPQPEEKDKEEEDRIDFVNVKDLIKGMEQKKEPAVSPMKTETNGFHKDNGHSKSEEDCETDGEKSLEKTDSTESESPSSHSNGLSNGVPLQAPKPLPRSSISEGGSGEEQEVPKPKPRTTAAGHGGYKPRLGPKPFSASAGSEEFSFDKVFSVPAAPGDQKNQSAVTTPVTSTPKAESEEKEKSLSPTSDVETTTNKEEYTNGKSDTSMEEEVSSDSGYRPKTPGTAERRKLFENTTTTVTE
ncbi:hypothetical protein JYU34_010650 [Plutella xylostella]|uniref:Uncharacterized protein n=1 Tax=Plutella xylostella TaxID=51655 RepID=A0ABQ7QJC8_PLUXY|nr:hypothetical protein JYU34_010650 [Plutella xylostella]